MNNFESQLDRMKTLFTYGQVTESVPKARDIYTIEYHATAADGREYGIIRECNKFYIKTCPKGKEMIPEAYDYIGGIANKKDYEYNSYNNALKNFELKMSSINEAHDSKVNIEDLDPFMKKSIVEGSDAMKSEIARVRQIMHNASMIMNESNDFVGVKTICQPESAHGHSSDKNSPFTDSTNSTSCAEKGTCKSASNPEKQSAPFGNSQKTSEGEEISVKDSVASMKPSGGKVTRVNENELLTDDPNSDKKYKLAPNDSDFGTDDDIEDSKLDDTDIDTDTNADDTDMDTDDSEFDTDDTTDVNTDDSEFDTDDADNSDFDTDYSDFDGADVDESDYDTDVNADMDTDVDTDDSEFDTDNTDVDTDDSEFDTDDTDTDEKDKDALFESIINDIVKEIKEEQNNKSNNLHVFGKHPGYRKKPMTLPTTGDDKTIHGKDWNDDSVHSEEPFGSKIGKGLPFDILVDKVTDRVVNEITKQKKK